MPSYVLERVVPAGFDPSDKDQAALHSRWAADAYAENGIVWLGGVATGSNMYSLIVGKDEEHVHRYCRTLRLSANDYTIHPVTGVLGPFVAMSTTDERYRPPAHRL
jgi:hypothetical protein